MTEPKALHSWELDETSARELQRELAGEVNVSRPLGPVRLVAAADVSYDRGSPVLYAAVVVMTLPDFQVVEKSGYVGVASFPYIPGLLSFREAPAVLAAFQSLKSEFDVVLCDGQGIAHPRRFGLACHLGLWLRKPTIGCAKSRLCGAFEPPGLSKGDRSPLTDKGDVIGDVLRTRDRVSPLFVSPGHLCDRAGATRVVLETLTRYRLPIPARAAHDFVNELRRGRCRSQHDPR